MQKIANGIVECNGVDKYCSDCSGRRSSIYLWFINEQL